MDYINIAKNIITIDIIIASLIIAIIFSLFGLIIVAFRKKNKNIKSYTQEVSRQSLCSKKKRRRMSISRNCREDHNYDDDYHPITAAVLVLVIMRIADRID